MDTLLYEALLKMVIEGDELYRAVKKNVPQRIHEDGLLSLWKEQALLYGSWQRDKKDKKLFKKGNWNYL